MGRFNVSARGQVFQPAKGRSRDGHPEACGCSRFINPNRRWRDRSFGDKFTNAKTPTAVWFGVGAVVVVAAEPARPGPNGETFDRQSGPLSSKAGYFEGPSRGPSAIQSTSLAICLPAASDCVAARKVDSSATNTRRHGGDQSRRIPRWLIPDECAENRHLRFWKEWGIRR